MDIGLVFKVFSNRDKIERLVELLSPVFDTLKPAIPEIMSLGAQLAAELFPDMVKQGPIATFDVAWLQTSLNKLGQKPPLTVDGVMGQGTLDVVKVFQLKHNLTPDGWPGIETCSAILVELAKVKS